MTPFLSELFQRRPQGPGPAKPKPPHLSKGNQSDQSGAAQWGWQTRPSPDLSSPPASAVGFQVTKVPRVSQKSVTSPAPPWQGSLSDQVLPSPSPRPSPTGGLARGFPSGQQSVGRGWDDHKPKRFRFHSPPKEGVWGRGEETRPEFKGSRLGLGSLHLGGGEGGTRPGRGRKAKKGTYDNIYAQNPASTPRKEPATSPPASPLLQYSCACAIVVPSLPSPPIFPESSGRARPSSPRMQSVRKRWLLPLFLRR